MSSWPNNPGLSTTFQARASEQRQQKTTVETCFSGSATTQRSLITRCMSSPHLPGAVQDPGGNPTQSCVLDGHMHGTFRWSCRGRSPPCCDALAEAGHTSRRMQPARARKGLSEGHISISAVYRENGDFWHQVAVESACCPWELHACSHNDAHAAAHD